jgi:hypothetical protein
MKPEERDAVRAALAELIAAKDQYYGVNYAPGDQHLVNAWSNARTALTAQSPAGVPPEPFLLADAKSLMRWARMRVEDRVITQHDMDAVADMLGKLIAALAGVPTTEPVAPIARLLADALREMLASGVEHETRGYKTIQVPHITIEEGRAALAAYDAAPQAPAEPQGEVQPYLLHDGTNWERGDCVVRQAAEPVAQEPVVGTNALRDALQKIAAIEDEMFGGDWDEIERARAIARAALEGQNCAPAAQPNYWVTTLDMGPGKGSGPIFTSNPDIAAKWCEAGKVTPLYASPISLPVEVARLECAECGANLWCSNDPNHIVTRG